MNDEPISRSAVSWLSRAVLLKADQISENLKKVEEAGVVPRTPNLWQLSLGVLRMWHRIVFRSDTIGMSDPSNVRDTWRARALHHRPIRFPFLVKEKAIAPLDLTGLASSPDRLIRHLLGAHHDRAEFLYDLQILACYPGKLEELRDRLEEIVHTRTRRAEWLRDLVVFEGYHQRLYDVVVQGLDGGVQEPEELAGNPDFSFVAYLDWCAAQPETPEETFREWRRGVFRVASGRTEAAAC